LRGASISFLIYPIQASYITTRTVIQNRPFLKFHFDSPLAKL